MKKGMTQVKFTIESDIVAAFKSHCAGQSVSMASEIRLFMNNCRPNKNALARIDSRPYRRKTVSDMIGLLISIADMESKYRDNIPEQFAQRYDAADRACDALDEAISSLKDAY